MSQQLAHLVITSRSPAARRSDELSSWQRWLAEFSAKCRARNAVVEATLIQNAYIPPAEQVVELGVSIAIHGDVDAYLKAMHAVGWKGVSTTALEIKLYADAAPGER